MTETLSTPTVSERKSRKTVVRGIMAAMLVASAGASVIAESGNATPSPTTATSSHPAAKPELACHVWASGLPKRGLRVFGANAEVTGLGAQQKVRDVTFSFGDSSPDVVTHAPYRLTHEYGQNAAGTYTVSATADIVTSGALSHLACGPLAGPNGSLSNQVTISQ